MAGAACDETAGMLGKMQQMLLPLGFITPENLKNSTDIGVQGLGLSGVERFATFPQGDAAKQPIRLPQPQQAPGTDPQTLIAIEKARGEAKVQVATVTAEARAKTDALKSQADAQENQHLNQIELQRHSIENQQEMQAQKYKTIADIVIAHINAAAKIEAAQVAAGVNDGEDAAEYERAGERSAA